MKRAELLELTTKLVDTIKENIRSLISRVEALESLTAARDGKDGANGLDGKDGADGRNGTDGKDGERGADGKDGRDGKDGINGKDGRDGKDGEAGEDGRDAIEVDVLPGIDDARSYSPRTFASHLGGIWMTRRKSRGMDGWECVVDGVADIEISLSGEREFTVEVVMSSGRTKVKKFSIPSLIDRGVWRQGQKYVGGDGVSWRGSFWIAQKETDQQPGEKGVETGWRLAVKKGTDGKDGPKGDKGDRGDGGRAGRDLTQMNFEGGKY